MSAPAKVSEHHFTRRVQFYETDAAGIVHFSWFFRFMEEAEHALWRAAGLSIAPPGSPYGFPRVSATCDYKSPLRFEDEVDVHVRIVEMTGKSLRYACTVSAGSRVAAELGMTVLCVTSDAAGAMRATSLPAHVRDRLEVAADAVA
jgi:acyl-CoA thioester hydrolase